MIGLMTFIIGRYKGSNSDVTQKKSDHVVGGGIMVWALVQS